MTSLCDSSQSRCDSNLQKHFCLWCVGVTGFWTLVRQRSGGCREAKLLPVGQEAEGTDWCTFWPPRTPLSLTQLAYGFILHFLF